MSQKLYKVEDIQLLFKELKVEIKKLKCFIEECCSKIPINVGSGATLFKRLYRNNWEFKSILPGSNITITEQDDTITINSTGGGTVSCDDVKADTYTHLRSHETPEHLVCRLLLETKKITQIIITITT